MEIALFKHNQTAYEAAVGMMEEVGKAVVIHPTGLGNPLLHLNWHRNILKLESVGWHPVNIFTPHS